MILFLHGYIKGMPMIETINREGLPMILEEDDDFPFLVVSPHRNEGYLEYWYQDKNVKPMFLLLEEITSLYSVDPQRIYLSGESAGANGVWEIGLQYPDRFAALVPMMGYYGYPFAVPENICDLRDVPIWAFHGALDNVVPLDAEQSLVDALKACGGSPQLTVFPDAGHELDAHRVYTPELTEWLLSQTLK